MSAPPSTTVAWPHRLSVRLAVLMTAAMLVFHFAGDALALRIHALFGLPDLSEFYVLDTEWIEPQLLDGAAEEAPGRWRPTEEALELLDEEFVDQGLVFLWLDTTQQILATSDGVPWVTGETWEGSLEPYFETTLPDGGETAGTCAPVYRDDVLAGRLVSLMVDVSAHAAWHEVPEHELADLGICEFTPVDAPVFSDDREANAWLDRAERLDEAVSLGTTVVLAVLLAFVVSRLVTRRLSRLAALASEPVPDDGDLPGPFFGGGRDEIGALARALDVRRERVMELVEGLASTDTRRREWVAQVSHDLRTPLTALGACLDRAEQMLSRGDAVDAAAMTELVAVARLDADRVNALADDLLDIARLEASDSLDLEPVPPGELVRGTVTALGPLAQAGGVELVADLAPGLPIPDADGRRMARALENLVRNAIHFARSRVEVRAREADGRLRLEVRDDGEGLPEQDGEVLWETLRGHRSREDSAGLGLLVTERVAQAHGGDVGAHNLPEGGGAVWLDIPIHAPG
jgi:signal transduction histidine kinase